jgi:HD superfamily phosphohydrolase
LSVAGITLHQPPDVFGFLFVGDQPPLMTTIKDSVHDHIEIHGVAAALLDTPPVQRLRRISQLGTVTLVYPSANHTRFEHSLGVYHLADRALDHLAIEGQQAERVRAAALLHDVGHCPYSHNIEDLLYRHTGKYHDEVHDLIGSGPVASVLSEHGLNTDRIADLIAGEGELGQLVSGELDVDRMDYLVRDAHHTGVPYGTIDHERLVRELRFVDGDLVLDEGNVQTAESLLLARALMNPTVYQHHVARIAKSMLRRGTEQALDAGATDPETVRRMDDYDLHALLRDCEASAEIARQLDERDLYKRAVWAEYDAVPDNLFDADHGTIRRYERDIADEAGVDPTSVILDVPPEPTMTESTSQVLVNGEVRQLGNQSTLVNALRAAQQDQWRLGIYAPPEEADRVGNAAIRTLGLDLDGILVRDVRTGINATLDEFGAASE